MTVLVPFVLVVVSPPEGPRDDELRELAAFPSVVEGPLDPATWASVDAWLVDRLPLRTEAIEFDRRLTSSIDNRFGRSIEESDQVAEGDAGWLFFSPSFEQFCFTEAHEEAWAAEIGRARSLLASTGRDLVVAVAPDRGSIVPERLGDIDRGCVGENAELVANLADDDVLLDLGAVVRGENDALRLDTHWSPSGALSGAGVIVDAIAPGVFDATGVTFETVELQGDLQRLIGDTGTEPVRMATLTRQFDSAIERVETSVEQRPMFVATNPDGVDRSVLFLHDSFGGYRDPTDGHFGAGADYVRPWFTSFVNLRLNDTLELLDDPPVNDALRDADVVGLLFVQRTIGGRLGTGLLVGPLVAALVDELAAVDIDVGGGDVAIGPAPTRAVVVATAPTGALGEELAISAPGDRRLARADLGNSSTVLVEQGDELIVSGAQRIRFVELP